MTFDRSALILGMICAYDSWLGKDKNGPERYLYRSAHSVSFDSIRSSTFFEYWKLQRSMLRQNQIIFINHCMATMNTITWHDNPHDFKKMVQACATYPGPKKAETAASKMLINFFPKSGYIVDSRAHEAIKYLLKCNQLSKRSSRLDRFEFFYKRRSIISLHRDIKMTLPLPLKTDLSSIDEENIFAWRVIDKYLFFLDKNRSTNYYKSNISKNKIKSLCNIENLYPSYEACDFTLSQWKSFAPLFGRYLSSI